jgi:hypothetical protein
VVVALEFLEGLLLVGAHHVRDVLLGVDIADAGLRALGRQPVADGLHQVGLAEADPAIDEQRVVGDAGVLSHLHCGGPRQLVGFAGDEIVEAEIPVQAGAIGYRRRGSRPGRRGRQRRRGRQGAQGRVRCSSAREHQLDVDVAIAGFGGKALDACGKSLAHVFQYETVGCSKHQGR